MSFSLAMTIMAGALALYGAVVTFLLIRNPLPIPDRGFRIFATPSDEARKAIVGLLQRCGLEPRYQIDSADVQRILMSDGVTVINTTSPALYAQMGNPAAGLALVARDPRTAANAAVAYLRSQGFTAQNLGELDPDVPAGAMYFVHTDALSGCVLVFRKHITKMGARPPRWKK